MLKKILGEAPFDVCLYEKPTITQNKKSFAELEFINTSEYDLPLTCFLKMNSILSVDSKEFHIIIPAEGKTCKKLIFSLPEDCKIVGGSKLCELEITDGIFDSRTEYEFTLDCEMAYKCSDSIKDAFLPSEDIFFTRNGVFFGNKGEIISMELTLLEETTLILHMISGKIKNFNNEKQLLPKGLCKMFFEMETDGCFEFINPLNEETMFTDTVNPKYFI